MIRIYIFAAISLFYIASPIYANDNLSVDDILDKIDFNMYSNTQIITSKMIVHGRRGSRTIVSKSWIQGSDRAFTEYLSPPRDAGTKMLKDGDKLWTYSPKTDRIIQISGHMLRQSLMGSDMSYNDMLEDKELKDIYNALIEGIVDIDGRKHYVLLMEAKIPGLSYPIRRSWVDAEYMLPTKEELYAKSGKLLKSITIKTFKKINNKWVPTHLVFKDELKRNSRGTEWIVENIDLDIDIPENRFTKALLRK